MWREGSWGRMARWVSAGMALVVLAACGEAEGELESPEEGNAQQEELRSRYIGTACGVSGVAGTCQEVSACGAGHVASPGYCPGPSDIQCCTPVTPDDPSNSNDDMDMSSSPDEAPDSSLDGPAPDMDEEIPRSPHIGTSCEVSGVMGSCEDVSTCVGDYTPTAGHCPGPSEIQCCTLTPEQPAMPGPVGECDPQAAPTPNAGLKESEGQSGCPTGMVRAGSFCVDQYEGALVELLPGGGEQSWSPFVNPGTRAMRAVSIASAIPQGYINADQAESACRNAGKRLCSSQEWLRACQGPQGTTYPYGNTRQPGVCNDARSQHPAVQYFGTSADWIWSQLGHRCINQQADTVVRGEDRVGCVSAEGAHHMMGNLHEWVSDVSGTFRGGFYADTLRNGDGCLYRTTAHARSHWDYSTGFRCCADQR